MNKKMKFARIYPSPICEFCQKKNLVSDHWLYSTNSSKRKVICPVVLNLRERKRLTCSKKNLDRNKKKTKIIKTIKIEPANHDTLPILFPETLQEIQNKPILIKETNTRIEKWTDEYFSDLDELDEYTF